jgi:LDH2 family malate/lactate/ureidoglycolate dehydrogenase
MKAIAEKLHRFTATVLESAGLSKAHAEITAEILLFADLRGIESHGISKLPIYVKRIKDGGVDPKAVPEIVGRKGAVIRIDGKNALGQVAGDFGAARAVEAALEHGIGLAVVGNSNHFGVTAYYSMKGLNRGVIGFALSNANPTVAPWGGKKAMMGTSPLSVAIPTGSGLPFVIDMASTTVARGKIILYARKKKPLPSGWALDLDGKETTDPEVALKGLLAPLGGPKGSGLALVIDVLTGLLSGSKYLTEVGHLYSGTDKPQGIGHVFGALDIETFMPRDKFLSAMDDYVDRIHACPPADGVDRIYVPGEIEHSAFLRAKEEGVDISEDTINELSETGLRFGLRLDDYFM